MIDRIYTFEELMRGWSSYNPHFDDDGSVWLSYENGFYGRPPLPEFREAHNAGKEWRIKLDAELNSPPKPAASDFTAADAVLVAQRVVERSNRMTAIYEELEAEDMTGLECGGTVELEKLSALNASAAAKLAQWIIDNNT